MTSAQHATPGADEPSAYEYLVRDALRPGDVLLTLDPSFESKMIAWSSGGAYSHAAFFRARDTLFESDDSGAGFSYLYGVKAYVDGCWHDWLRLRKPCANLLVLRHPGVAGLPAAQVEDGLEKMTRTRFGDPYSKLDRLAEASILPTMLRPALGWFLRRQDDRDAKAPLEGVFCSELVAEFFGGLGLPLAPNLAPHEISPNHLAGSPLRPVPEAVVSPATAARARREEWGKAFASPLLEREEYLKPVVGAKESGAVMAQTLSQVTTVFERIAVLARQGVFEVAEQTRRSLIEELELAIRIGDLRQAEAVKGLIDQWVEYCPKAAQVLTDPAGCDPADADAYTAFLSLPLRFARRVFAHRQGWLEASRGKWPAWTRWAWRFTALGRLRRRLVTADAVAEEKVRSLSQSTASIRRAIQTASRLRSRQLAAAAAYASVRVPRGRGTDDHAGGGEEVRKAIEQLWEAQLRVEADRATSKEVLSAALASARAKDPECLEGELDPALWLQLHVSASISDSSSGIMRVEVSGAAPSEVLALADAIVDAYLERAPARWIEDAERRAKERYAWGVANKGLRERLREGQMPFEWFEKERKAILERLNSNPQEWEAKVAVPRLFPEKLHAAIIVHPAGGSDGADSLNESASEGESSTLRR